MISSYVGENPEFARQYLAGELELEFTPQVYILNFSLITKENLLVNIVIVDLFAFWTIILFSKGKHRMGEGFAANLFLARLISVFLMNLVKYLSGHIMQIFIFYSVAKFSAGYTR